MRLTIRPTRCLLNPPWTTRQWVLVCPPPCSWVWQARFSWPPDPWDARWCVVIDIALYTRDRASELGIVDGSGWSTRGLPCIAGSDASVSSDSSSGSCRLSGILFMFYAVWWLVLQMWVEVEVDVVFIYIYCETIYCIYNIMWQSCLGVCSANVQMQMDKECGSC